MEILPQGKIRGRKVEEIYNSAGEVFGQVPERA